MIKICNKCNKPIKKWNNIYILWELDHTNILGDGKKLYFHKRTCERRTWKMESYYIRLETKVKKLDKKVINRQINYKRNKKNNYKKSRLCACGTCEHV